MDKISGILSEHKGQDLKKQLLECLDKESQKFSDIARSYFSKETLSKEDRTALLQAVVAAIDHVLTAGEWDSSLFLRNTLKPLLAIKAEALAGLQALKDTTCTPSFAVHSATDGECEVYISLFQSDGYNISKWAMQLRSLERYIIGRPIYQQEADIEKRMRLRNAGENEAYVVVVVKKNDIQSDPFAAPLRDQFDHPLFLLKETALKNGRINAFIHQGMRYYFIDGQLVKQ